MIKASWKSNPEKKHTGADVVAFKAHSLRVSRRCEKVKLYDDDPGTWWGGYVQNKEFKYAHNRCHDLEHDLEEDIKAVELFVK